MHILVHIIGLVIVLAGATSTNALLLGSSRCTWGPSYWCSHVGTMKECKSSGYCSRIWQRGSSEPSSQDSSPEDCSFCRLLASDLDRLVRANLTVAESRRLATSACSLVPQPRSRSLCLAVVDNYMDEVTQLLKDGLTADRLCSALSLCGSGRRDHKLLVAMETPVATELPLARVPLGNPEAEVPVLLLRGAPVPVMSMATTERLRSSFCEFCVEAMGIVEQAFRNKAAEAEVAQLMKEAVCSRLGGVQSLCNVWVDSYVPEIMKMLANKMNPRQLCIKSDFCPAASSGPKYHRHPLMQLMVLQKNAVKPLKDVECQVCEMLVAEARQMLRDNKTEAEIMQFVKDRVCGLVPAEKDKCIRAVTEYGPVIFQLLASELDPATVCQALGACGKSPAAGPAVPALPRRPRLGPQCLLCEYVMHEVDGLLGDNRTEAAIESALGTVCSIMPATVRQDCNDWVRQYTPVVLQLLSQDLSPAVVCTILGLCAGPDAPAAAAVRAAPSETTCDVCQTVILYVKSLLKENATEQEVMAVLEKVCNFLPSQEQPACRSFIEQYTPYIIQLLLQDVDPMQICQTIGLCTKAAAQRLHSQGLRYRPNGMVQMSRVGDPIV